MLNFLRRIHGILRSPDQKDRVVLNRPRSAKSGRNLLAVVLGYLVALALAYAAGETYVRLAGPDRTPKTLRGQALEYETSVFSRHTFPQFLQQKTRKTVHAATGSWSHVIMELGYRGRPFSLPKPSGLTRVVVLGGSAAFDIHSSEDDNWPALGEKQLRHAGFSSVEVVNAAVPGHATWNSLGRLYSELWMIEPDYIVAYHAWNDIKYFRWLSPKRSLLRGYRPPPTAPSQDDNAYLVDNPYIYYRNSLDRLLGSSHLYSRVRSRFWTLKLGKQKQKRAPITQPWTDLESDSAFANYSDQYSPWGPRQYGLVLSLIVDASRNIGADSILVTQARLVTSDNEKSEGKRINYSYVGLSHAGLVRAFSACDLQLKRVALEKKEVYLDLSSQLSGRSEFFLDQVHTTPAGSRAIAEIVGSLLGDQLRNRI